MDGRDTVSINVFVIECYHVYAFDHPHPSLIVPSVSFCPVRHCLFRPYVTDCPVRLFLSRPFLLVPSVRNCSSRPSLIVPSVLVCSVRLRAFCTVCPCLFRLSITDCPVRLLLPSVTYYLTRPCVSRPSLQVSSVCN